MCAFNLLLCYKIVRSCISHYHIELFHFSSLPEHFYKSDKTPHPPEKNLDRGGGTAHYIMYVMFSNS